MNNSINYAGFIEMIRNSNEDFEPYGCSEINETLETINSHSQANKTGLNQNRGYELDK
jgi:hypothetical protein